VKLRGVKRREGKWEIKREGRREGKRDPIQPESLLHDPLYEETRALVRQLPREKKEPRDAEDLRE